MRGERWPEEKLTLAKRMWLEGWSASVVAAEIGVTRSAVIGKMTRLEIRRPDHVWQDGPRSIIELKRIMASLQRAKSRRKIIGASQKASYSKRPGSFRRGTKAPRLAANAPAGTPRRAGEASLGGPLRLPAIGPSSASVTSRAKRRRPGHMFCEYANPPEGHAIRGGSRSVVRGEHGCSGATRAGHPLKNLAKVERRMAFRIDCPNRQTNGANERPVRCREVAARQFPHLARPLGQEGENRRGRS
jgi:hypothetical protein